MTTRSILERSICLVLTCHYLGNNRKVPVSDLVEAATGGSAALTLDERQFHATKRLIDPKEIAQVTRVQNAAKAYLRQRAIPAHRVFGERTYLVPIDAVTDVDSALWTFSAELRREASALADRYVQAVERQRQALGPLFRWADYASPDEVVAAFALDWGYVSFAVPDQLETVDRAVFAAARAKYEAKLDDAYEEVRTVLRASLREIVSEIAKKLAPAPDGTPRVFRNSILDGLASYLESFHIRNITDDAELSAVVAELRALTDGLQPQALRDSDALREAVRRGVDDAMARLDDLLVSTSGRAISFAPIAAVLAGAPRGGQ